MLTYLLLRQHTGLRHVCKLGVQLCKPGLGGGVRFCRILCRSLRRCHLLFQLLDRPLRSLQLESQVRSLCESTCSVVSVELNVIHFVQTAVDLRTENVLQQVKALCRAPSTVSACVAADSSAASCAALLAEAASSISCRSAVTSASTASSFCWSSAARASVAAARTAFASASAPDACRICCSSAAAASRR